MEQYFIEWKHLKINSMHGFTGVKALVHHRDIVHM